MRRLSGSCGDKGGQEVSPAGETSGSLESDEGPELQSGYRKGEKKRAGNKKQDGTSERGGDKVRAGGQTLESLGRRTGKRNRC